MIGRKRRSKSLPEWDDGRTIADMNVDGMPWYAPEREGGEDRTRKPSPPTPMSREEGRVFLWGAMKAALLVAGVMCAGLVLFVLFCQHVWLR